MTPVNMRGGKLTVHKLFATASMNFTHFATTDRMLAPGETQELLHRLMFSQAALQLSTNQSVWDLLIPIYLGKREDRFDPAKLTALLIQVKNSCNPNPCLVLKKDYESLFRLDNPIVTILVDLGSASQASYQPNHSLAMCSPSSSEAPVIPLTIASRANA